MSAFGTGKAMCAIVCDGAGSAELGGQGASVVCRTLTQGLRQHFAASDQLPSDDDIWSWIDLARDRLGLAADRREKARRAFASTMILLIISGDTALTAHVGDGAVVARIGQDAWSTLSEPANGEYASMTYFVTDDPSPQLRISRFSEAFTGFAIFSDGIENLALDHKNNEPHAPFFKTMLAPLDGSSEIGRIPKLSAALAAFLGGTRVCEKTDDDKTLILLSSR